MALGVLCLCFFCVVFDNAKLALALPAMTRELGLSPSESRWVVEANLIVYASSLLPGGALCERFGPRRLLLSGLAIFGFGSLLSALAASAPLLIATRSLVGVGASLVTPAALAGVKLAATTVDLPRRLAFWTASFGLGAALGPLAAGALLASSGYRGVLWANLPVSALCALGVFVSVPRNLPTRDAALDPLGALLAFVAIASLVWGILGTAAQGSLAQCAPAFALAVLAAWLLYAWQRRARSPMLEPAFFKNPRFRSTLLVIVLTYLAYAGVSFVAAQHLQLGWQQAPFSAGLMLLPLPCSMLAGTLLAPRLLARFGATQSLLHLLALNAFGAVGLWATAAQASPLWFCLVEPVFGLGAGGAFVVATELVVGSANPERAGAAAALNEAAFEVGGVLGIAWLGALSEGANGGSDGQRALWSSLLPLAASLALAEYLRRAQSRADAERAASQRGAA